jgi:predicted ATPase
VGEQHRGVGRAESNLVGRRWEMSAVEGLLDRAIDGHGAVVGVVGPPGIGKSRLVREIVDAERDRGEKLLAGVGEEYLRRGHNLCDLSIVNVYLAREIARRGDRDEALPLMRAAADHLFRDGQLLGWGVPATGVLV